MRFKQLSRVPVTYALIFETGDEIAAGLKTFAKEHKLKDASFKAIGALEYVKVGWFDWDKKKYETAAELNEQVELLSMIGDVALKDGEPQVHAHLVIGKRDGTAHGGHLLEARVRPTCELILTESPAELHKEIDPKSGIALIRV
jgi:uncharacterized protein